MFNVLTAFDTTASILIGRRDVDPSVYAMRPSNIWIMGSNLGSDMNIPLGCVWYLILHTRNTARVASR
jgi:hypothetical protein